MLSRSFSCTSPLAPSECAARVRDLLGHTSASLADVVCREAELASWSVDAGPSPVRFEGFVSDQGFSLSPLPSYQLSHSIHGTFVSEGDRTTILVRVSAFPRQVGLFWALALALLTAFTVLVSTSPSPGLFAGSLGAVLLLALALAALEVHQQFTEFRAVLARVLLVPAQTPEA